MRLARRFSIQRRPSGLRRRLLLHHTPLALASAVVLVLFMTVPPFDATRYAPGNIFTDWYPREEFSGGPTGQAGTHRPPQHPPPRGGGGGGRRRGAPPLFFRIGRPPPAPPPPLGFWGGRPPYPRRL